MKTIYFSSDFTVNDLNINELEREFKVDIGLGSDYINVYTNDESIILNMINRIGQTNVEEWS